VNTQIFFRKFKSLRIINKKMINNIERKVDVNLLSLSIIIKNLSFPSNKTSANFNFAKIYIIILLFL
jgi:hypothetical protein